MTLASGTRVDKNTRDFLLSLLLGLLGIAALFAVCLWLCGLVDKQQAAPHESGVKQFSDVLTVIGLLSAGAFFLYKMVTGWLIINLSVAIEAKRYQVAGEPDLLVVQLALDKSTTDAIWLKAVEWRVLPLNKSGEAFVYDPQIKPMASGALTAEKRYQTNAGGRLEWSEDASRTLTLSPGEKYFFAQAFRVPADTFCQVEVVVLGNRPLWRHNDRAQWRAVTIVAPIPL